MHRRQACWPGLGILFAASIATCGGGAVPSAAPSTVGPSPQSTASPTAAPVASQTAAPTDTPAPSRSHKPLPSIDQTELDAILTSSITLLDLADGDLSVTVSYVDPTSGEAIDLGVYDLGSTEQQTQQVPPGTYKLEFRSSGAATAQACTIEVGDKDAITFAAVDDAVAVGKAGSEPAAARELFVATSSLCGH